MRFSDLAIDFTGETHPLYALRERLVDDSAAIIDLVRGNPTEHGLAFPQDILREILSESISETGIYRPDSSGQVVAREAIRNYYGQLDLSAENILLTPGTSVSYWYCFKLLAESGDEILCPSPSYPLLDYIAKICGVTLTNYSLDESRNWAIDFEDLTRKITSKTRAIVLISPHNPTGMVCSTGDIDTLAQIAAERDLPIISDEVFGEFLFELDYLPRLVGSRAPLVFTLNGFSKSFALPGLKLGWIAVSGDTTMVKRSLSVLEMISDTFLPVNEIVQFSVPKIFQRGREFQRNYVKAISRLRAEAIDVLNGSQFVPPQGGFYITLPVGGDEDEVALSLLQHNHIFVHPGHFYEIEGNHLVMSFVQESSLLTKCLESIKTIAG